MFAASGRNVYACSLLWNMLWSCGLMSVVHLFPLSKSTREGVSLMICQLAWRLSLFFAPWIKCLPDEDYVDQWSVILGLMAESDAEAAANGTTPKPLFVIANHTCFFDTVLSVCKFPGQVMWRVRTYMSAGLFKLPVLSTLCKSVGHFPVYFASDEAGKFKVDSARMEKVEAEVDAHLKSGGWLCFFPEGQMNLTPDKILPFRYGGMKRAVEFDARIVSLVTRGNTSVWPRTAKVGGFPGQVRYSLKNIAPHGVCEFLRLAREEGAAEEKEMKDHEILARRMQEIMQIQYDQLATPSGKALKQTKAA